MVAVVTGSGLGLLDTSLNILGELGILGQSGVGQGSAHAYVNAASGNLVLQLEDERLSGRGLDLEALRTYNSLGAAGGARDGWRWSYERCVRFEGPGTPAQPSTDASAIRTDGDAHDTTYRWHSARGCFLGTEGGGAFDELRYDSGRAEWVWTGGSTRVVERYGDSTNPAMTGRMIQRSDRSGNSVVLSYDDGGRLTLIDDAASHQQLHLVYGPVGGAIRLQHLKSRTLLEDPNGHPTATLGPAIQRSTYGYDASRRLITVTRSLDAGDVGETWVTTFSYDGSTGRIASMVHSDGTALWFGYDPAGRVSTVNDRSDSSTPQLTLTYGEATKITDGNGEVWTFRYDQEGHQLVEVITPPVDGAALSTRFSYDPWGSPVEIHDARGNTVTYTYDTNGNRIRERDQFGNLVTRTFSGNNQLLTETRYRKPDAVETPSGGEPLTTRYAYDDSFRLRFVVSAEGRVTESRHGTAAVGYGLLTGMLQYTGQTFDVTNLPPAGQLTESQLVAWADGLQDKTQVQLTAYTYDLRGNPSQQISYATADASGAGVLDDQAGVTEYDHDAHGRLRRQTVLRGAGRDQRTVTTSFSYDGIGRVMTRSDADGTATTVYEDADHRVTVTGESGQAETRSYDSRGRLVIVRQSGDTASRETRYVYDNADLLRMTEDALGGRRFRFYDAAGRLTGTVDASGAVTGSQYNATGQVIQRTQYAYRADTTGWYDPATQTVTKTSLTVEDPDGDVVPDPTQDRITRFSYDAAGRLAETINAVGAIETRSYDGASCLTRIETGDRVTRQFYDKDNQQLGVVDALGYLTEHQHDAAARLVEIVRYGRRAPAGPEATGDQQSDTEDLSGWRPADGATLRTHLRYDGRGRVIGSVDERQFLTETVYDDAANTQRTLRYLTPVTVAPDDTLAALRARAGASRQLSLVAFDPFSRLGSVVALDTETVTRYGYDDAGRVTRVVAAADTSEQRGRRTFYNAFGDVTATLGGEGDAWLGTDATPERIQEAIRSYGTRHEFDDLGRRIRSVDANDNLTLFYYDAENRLTHTIHALGHRADHTLAGEVSETIYTSFGQPASVRHYARRLSDSDMEQLLSGGGGGSVDQSLSGLLAALADPANDLVTSFGYDRAGRLVQEIDGEAGVTLNSYDSHGALVARTRSIAPGRTTTTQVDHDLLGREISRTEDVGGVNANARSMFDGFGRVTGAIDGAGHLTTIAYDDGGRTVTVTDPLNRVRSTEFDALDRRQREVDALSRQTDFAYDEAARSVTVTTPEGIRTTTVRTRHDEIASTTDGRGNSTTYTYDKNGQQTTVTDPLAHTVASMTYDRSGRKVEVTDARGTVTRFAYDQRNRVVEQRVDPDGLNLTTRFGFDALGRQITVTEGATTAAARLTRYTYDRKNQRTEALVDPGGLALLTRHTFDGLGNVIRVDQGTTSSPSQSVTVVDCDPLGRTVATTVAPTDVFGPGSHDTRDLTTAFRYDAGGRPSCTIQPDGARSWSVYDAAGQQIQAINALGEVSETSYDANGRPSHHRRYARRLSGAEVAALGDVVTAPVILPTTAGDQRRYIVHDDDGRQRYLLQANISTSWTVAENRLDANGNVIETVRYDKFLPEAQLEAMHQSSPGITVAEIQAALIALGYHDADDTPLAKTQRTRVAYDANDRPRFTVDALGSVRESIYDPAGLLVSSVQYAARPPLTSYTEAAIDAALDRTHPDNQVSHAAYDPAGRLRYNVMALASDASGTPTRQLISEQAHDVFGQVIRTTSYATPVGPVADYTTATLANAIIPDPGDRRTAVVYDAAGRQVYRVQVLTPGGDHIVTKRAFDALDRTVSSTSYATALALVDFDQATLDHATAANATAQDRTTRFSYDAAGRQRFAVGADGSLSEKVYDACGRILESRQFDLLVDDATPPTETALSAARADRAVGDGHTRGETYGYDAAGRLLRTTDAAGFTETSDYNGLGDKTSFVDKNGARWRYEYDRQGQLFDQYAPPVPVQLSDETAPTSRSLRTRLYRDAFGQLVKRIDAAQTIDQRISEYGYDRLGRQIVTVQPGWYDPATGRVEQRFAPGRFQRSLAATFDTLGNRIRTRLRTGAAHFQAEDTAYDKLGRAVYHVDASSHVTAIDYNAFGDQAAVTRFSADIGTSPDGEDAPWTVPQLAGVLADDSFARTMTMDYDALGRKIQTRQPAAASYFYSGATARFVPPGSSITPESGSGSTTFTYNAFGELHHQTVELDPLRTQETWRYYDVRGRETRTVTKSSDNIAGENSPPRPGGFHTARSYDAVGNLTRVIEYAAEGEATPGVGSRTAPPAPPVTTADRITSYSYDVRNQRTDTLRSNLTYTALAGDDYVEVEVGRDESVPVQHTDYDGQGQAIASTDAMTNTTRTSYDALGRVIQVAEPARLVVRTGLSNPDPFLPDSQAVTTPVTDLVLNAFGQTVTSERTADRNDVAGAASTTRFSYDFGGNPVSTTDARGNVKNWRYDFSGRLVGESQEISATLGRRFAAATQNLQVWKVISHTIERRYAYDAVGHLTHVLDVFQNGPSPTQSGRATSYNAFGEVTDEQLIWGSPGDALNTLQRATRLHHSYDNAGNLVARNGPDGQTRFFYNLTGQLTRAERRGDNSSPDAARTEEVGYDLLGRAVWQSKPAFASTKGMVTPTTTLRLDRWGNTTGRTEVSDLGNGFAGSIRSTYYVYNADNALSSAELGFAPALRADGTSYTAIVTHHTHYDLAGRAVEELDVAEDTSTLPGSIPASTLRTHRSIYDSIGQLREDQDAEQTRQHLPGRRHAYDAAGNRIATLTAVGTVFVETFDPHGNHLTHAVLRLPPGGENDPYLSGSGTVPVAVLLTGHGYDQAHRRIETRNYVSASLRNAHYTQYDERGFARGTFELQETATSLPYSEDPGRETSCDYDVLGNKVAEVDASGHRQTWSYDVAADSGGQPNPTIGRLASSTSTAAGGTATHTTAYAYTPFGQVGQETYTGTEITDPTAQNHRIYDYTHNGLIALTTDVQSVGTPGPLGGLDSWASVSTNKYRYTDRGLPGAVEIDTSGCYEDYAAFGGVIVSKPVQPERRSISTSYDERDRPVGVTNSSSDVHGVSTRSCATVSYAYDELGNHTKITFSSVARSTMPGGNTLTGEEINGRQLWFDYDHDGRMTLAGKTVEQGGAVTDAGAVISYDPAGRRATTLTRQGREIRGFTDPETGHVDTEAWDQSRLERYGYDDLEYLTAIDQAGIRSNKLNLVTNTPIPDDPGPSPYLPSETRHYDFLGNLTDSSQYSAFRFVDAYDMTMDPQSLLVAITNTYTAAGLLDTQTSTHPGNPRANSTTKNYYDDHGILQSYTYTKGDGLGTDASTGFQNTYSYSYSFKAGVLREGGIDVESNLPDTTTTRQRNTYDGRGNLVWQRSIDGPGNTEMIFFDYDGSGQVLDKSEIELPPTRQVISGDTYNSFFYNSRGEAIGNVPASSFTATSARLHANFALGYTPISPTYPSSQPTSYAIGAGDTLSSIAKSFLGDEQLWYLIADANGLTTGPTDSLLADVGRSLRLPNVVTNIRNSADTLSPYNPNTIIANTPWVGAPMPPPGPTPWDQAVEHLAPIVGMATSLVLAVTLSELGPLGAGIAVAAGDAVSQSIQGRLDPAEVAEAGLTGFITGGASTLGATAAAASGGSLAAQILAQGSAAAISYAVNSGVRAAFQGDTPTGAPRTAGSADRGPGGSFDGWELLTAVVGAGTTPVLGGFVSHLAQEALNPATGWVWHPNARAWEAFYQDLAVGLGQLVVRDTFGSPQPEPPKRVAGPRALPPAVLEDAADTEGDLAAQFAGSQEVLPADQSTHTLLDDMEPGIHRVPDTSGRLGYYQYEIDADGRMTSFTDANGITTVPETIQVTSPATTTLTPSSTPATSSSTPSSTPEQFWSAVRAVQATQEARRRSEEAVARLVQDPRLQEIQRQLAEVRRQIAESEEQHIIVGGRTQAIRALEAERQKIVDSYDPAIPRSSPALPVLPTFPATGGYLNPSDVFTRAEVYAYPKPRQPLAANIVPERPQPFGTWGNTNFDEHSLRSSVEHSYAYDGGVTGLVETNDLDRIARTPGIQRIFVGGGVHGNSLGNMAPDPRLYKMLQTAAADVMTRHPGLQIDVLDLADPIRLRLFRQLQQAAAGGTAYGTLQPSTFATLGASCFSAACAPQGPPGEPTISHIPGDPEFRTIVSVPAGSAPTYYAFSALQIASGALNLYAGINQSNAVVGALGATGGAAQITGGLAWIYGMSRESVPAISLSSTASAVGNYLTAPLTVADVLQDMSDPTPRSTEENVFRGTVDAGKLAGIFYFEAALAALGAEYVVKPAAEKASEYLTPRFMGAISEAYPGIPASALWSWQ